MLIFGTAYSAKLVFDWYQSGYSAVPSSMEGLISLAALISGVQIIFSSFFISILSDKVQ